MRILGFIFLALLIASGIIALNYHFGTTYLEDFLSGHFIETFATLISFNIAAVIFLIGQLIVLEEKTNIEFINTRREIKQNSYYLLFSFVVSLLLLTFRPDYIINGSIKANLIHYVFNIFILMLFELAIFAIFEILRAVFTLGKTVNRAPGNA